MKDYSEIVDAIRAKAAELKLTGIRYGKLHIPYVISKDPKVILNIYVQFQTWDGDYRKPVEARRQGVFFEYAIGDFRSTQFRGFILTKDDNKIISNIERFMKRLSIVIE